MKRKLDLEALEARNLAAATLNPVSSLLSMQPPTQPAQSALVSPAVNGMVGKGPVSISPATQPAQTPLLSPAVSDKVWLGLGTTVPPIRSYDWVSGLRINHNETLLRQKSSKRSARSRQTRR